VKLCNFKRRIQQEGEKLPKIRTKSNKKEKTPQLKEEELQQKEGKTHANQEKPQKEKNKEEIFENEEDPPTSSKRSQNKRKGHRAKQDRAPKHGLNTEGTKTVQRSRRISHFFPK